MVVQLKVVHRHVFNLATAYAALGSGGIQIFADGGLRVAEFNPQAQARELGDAVQPFGAIERIKAGVADGLVARAYIGDFFVAVQG